MPAAVPEGLKVSNLYGLQGSEDTIDKRVLIILPKTKMKRTGPQIFCY